MSFAWPYALAALLLIPLLMLVAWLLRRRRRRAAVRVTSVALVRAVLPGPRRWRRHVPVALLIAALVLLGIGVARPQATVAVPSNRTTILLALDVSGSMCATDVEPNRLTAAQKAAARFIEAQPRGSRMGLVVFAGIAGTLVSPTDDKDQLLEALKGLTTARGTAIGQAILESIDTIAQNDPSIAPTGVDVAPSDAGDGELAADAIVVLTDGANTEGVDPQDAAKVAAARHIPVYTIGFGTTTPTAMVCSRSQVGDDQFGGGFGGPPGGFGGGGGFSGGSGGFGGGRNPLTIDEDALRQVAETTGGTYYRAESADQLEEALGDLPSHLTITHERRDLASWFAAAGGLLAAAAIGLSLWWGRVRTPR